MLTCTKRLRKELNNIEKNKDDQIELYVIDEVFSPSLFPLLDYIQNNIRQWGAVIHGPPDTPYHGYKFELRIDVGDEYPMAPPVIRYITKCFHPNIHFEVCCVAYSFLSSLLEW